MKSSGWNMGRRPTNTYAVDEFISVMDGGAKEKEPQPPLAMQSLISQTTAAVVPSLNNDVNSNDARKKPLLGNGRRAYSDATDLDLTKRVTFNVGGITFQTSEATIQKSQNTEFKLANPDFLQRFYDSSRGEYFFDRDPEVFRSVLNYWRSGRLHLPSSMCGPQIKEELDFWGLKELDIEPCCWNQYNTWMQTIASLQQLEKDRKPSYLSQNIPEAKNSCRLVLWNILSNPSYSKPARVYAYVSLFFVILAIFSFCASTHKVFQIEPDEPTKNNDASTLSPNISTNLNTTDLNGTYSTISTITSTTKSPDTTTEKEHLRDSFGPTVQPALYVIDIVCLVFFTLEYILKLICAPRRWHFVKTFTAIVDVLAVLPDYIEFLILAFHPRPADAEKIILSMPFLRLLRAFRIFRLIRRVPGLWIMIYTLKASFKELSLMLVFLLVGTLLFSSVIFFVDDTAVFTSIPHGFWWAIVTMTTVGYGDMTPKTAIGQIVGSITAICGVLIIGFTIPSLVNNFITFYQHVDFVVQKERLSTENDKRIARMKADEKEEALLKRECFDGTDSNKRFPHQCDPNFIPLVSLSHPSENHQNPAITIQAPDNE